MSAKLQSPGVWRRVRHSLIVQRVSWSNSGCSNKKNIINGVTYSNIHLFVTVTVVQSPSRVRLFATPWTAAHQASLSFTISPSLIKFMFIALVMPYHHLILGCPFLLLLSFFPSIRDFSNESAVHIRWPKYWNFSFATSHSNEFSGLISLRIDWLDLVVQGTLRSLLQHHIIKSGKSKIEVLADSISGEGPLLDSEMLPFCCHLTWWRGKGFFWGFSYKKSCNPICEDPTVMICSPPKESTSKSHHFGD